jgi:tetratricopeptide (TPR) repeat protein
MTQFKIAPRIGGATVIALLMCGLCAGTADAAAQQQISRAIAKEMTAAQKAMQAGQWAEAIKNLDAASAKSGLTAFDRSTIFDFKGVAYARQSNFKSAQTAFEQAVSEGGYPPEEVAKITHTLFGLAVNNQQYAKAIEYGKKVVDSGAASTLDFAILGQTYYLSKDCKDAVIWMDKAIAATRKAGETPKESFYQIKLQCAFDANNNAGTMATLEDLILATNKSEYWNQLIRFERQDEKDDRNLLMIYRVMFATDTMNVGSDYVEMAQLLLDVGLPGEAQAVVEKAFAAGLVKPEQKDRTTRILNAAKQRADVDRKGLVQLETESAKNPVGEADVKLGEVYYGFGDYQKAATAIQRAFGKGQIKHLDEAYVYLGLSQGALKNSAEAKKAFAGLKTVPNLSQRVLKLWTLYAEKRV